MKRTKFLLVMAFVFISQGAHAEKRVMNMIDLFKWIDNYEVYVDIAAVQLCEKLKPEMFPSEDQEKLTQTLQNGCRSAGSLKDNMEVLRKYPQSMAQSLAVLRDISDVLDSLSIFVNTKPDMNMKYIYELYFMMYDPHVRFYDHLFALAVLKDKGTRDIKFVK